MEEARNWMWTKSKHSDKSNFDASAPNSREEEAFAEDATRPCGAFIWPPRSYHCSFCTREFRSAQALGGHMNVHRRDRARLKQYSLSPHHHHQNQQHHIQNRCQSLLSPSRVSASSTQEHDKVSFFSSPPSWSDAVTIRILSISDSTINGKKASMKPYSEVRNEGDYVKPGSTVSSNFVFRPGEEETVSCKRRRTDEPSLPFFLKPSSISKHHLQSHLFGISPGAIEDLDLELRLGVIGQR